MNKRRKPRGVAAHAEGIKQLRQAKAASKDEKGKPLSHAKIAEGANVSDKTVERCFKQERIDPDYAYAITKVLCLDAETVFDFSEIEKHNRQPSEDKSASVEPTNVSDLQQACYELLKQQKKLTISSLMANSGIVLNLDDVFVPLGLVERRKRSERDDIDSAEHGSRLYNVAKEDIVQQFNHQQFFEQVIRDGNTPQSKGKRIAIIGEPGAGKTTQLQKIGDWILEETDGIPILISLSALGQKSLREYLSDDWLQTAISDLDVSQHHRDDLAQLLKTGKVWLLLDGIDEMTVADALHHVATQMREGWLQNVRVVLTCRLSVWDAGKNALDNFDVYRNLDFEYPTEVHQFIDKWFWDKPNLQQQLKDALEQPDKERIRDMVKNPLRLTLLCYSWHIRQGKLPETKAGLYEWFVDVFYEWNQGKVPIKLNLAKRRELNQALGELAREAIEQDSSRFRLSEKFIAGFLGDSNDEDSFFELLLKLGWLNPIGVAAENQFENVYAFLHPAFQEYFAALAIDDWDYFLPREHKDKPVEEKKYRIFESQWEETFLFWFGQKNDFISKAEIIDLLVNFGDSFDSVFEGYYYYQAYFLAVLALGESHYQFKPNQKLIEQTVELAFGYIKVDENKWIPSPDFIRDKAKFSLQQTNRLIAINVIPALLTRLVNEYPIKDQLEQITITESKSSKLLIDSSTHAGSVQQILFYASHFLAQLDPSNKKAIEVLRLLLDDEDINDVEILAISEFFPKNKRVIKLKEIQIEFDNAVSRLGIDFSSKLEMIKNSDYFKEISMRSESLIKTLHRSQEKADLTLFVTIERLGEVGRGDLKVILALLYCLLNSKNPSVLSKVYMSLEKVLNSDYFGVIVEFFRGYLADSTRTISDSALVYSVRIIWYCAQNMGYPDFYHAWYDSHAKAL